MRYMNPVEEMFAQHPQGMRIDTIQLTSSTKAEPIVHVEGCASDVGDFYVNLPMTKGFEVHFVNEFLREVAPDRDIEFITYAQYNELLQSLQSYLPCFFCEGEE